MSIGLVGCFDDLMHMLSSDTTVDMIYLDFSKAFNKVDHGVLLNKLKDLGITGKLGIWFFQFLTNRTHYDLKMRSLKNYDKKIFNNSLSSVDWNSIWSHLMKMVPFDKNSNLFRFPRYYFLII